MKTKITWAYIGGLLESDGSIRCDIDSKSGNLKPVIKISSKTNKNTLQDVKDFLEKSNIPNTIELSDPSSSNRAPSLLVQGKDHCLEFSRKLREFGVCMDHEGYKCSLLGNKQRDLLLIEAACNSDNSNKAKNLDLKKTFHKEDYFKPDSETKPIKPREEYEESLGILKGSSTNAAKSLILTIDSEFQQHLQKVDSFKGKLTGEYVAGLFDGDGGFNIILSVNSINKIITFSVDINLSLPLKDKHIFKAILTTLDLVKDNVSMLSQNNSVQLKIRREDIVEKTIHYFDKNPVLGNHKIKEIQLIKECFCLKRKGYLSKRTADIEKMKQFIKSVYDLSYYMKGKKRKPIEELLRKVDEFYGKK